MSDSADLPVPPSGESKEDSALNTAISIAVALGGTFMALSNVKDGNINQAMQDAQVRKVDSWNFYQAKSTKQHIAEGTLEQLRSLRMLSAGASSEAVASLDQKITGFQQKVERYEREKEEIKKEAKRWEEKYEELNQVDDQFDLSDAAMSVGIALSGVAALAKRRWLFGLAAAFFLFGVAMGLAGFFGWSFSVPFLSKWLS
jgi:hypothetical protein